MCLARDPAAPETDHSAAPTHKRIAATSIPEILSLKSNQPINFLSKPDSRETLRKGAPAVSMASDGAKTGLRRQAPKHSIPGELGFLVQGIRVIWVIWVIWVVRVIGGTGVFRGVGACLGCMLKSHLRIS